MKIIYSKILPPKGYSGINICGVLFVRKGVNITKRLINHEKIHTHQIKELLYIFFYVLYILEFIFRIVQYRNWNTAYRNISFEREAYNNQNNYTYLFNRRRYNWFRYLTGFKYQ